MKLYSKLNWFLLALGLILADQASKLGMWHWFPDYVTFNTGSAFSSPIPRGLVISLSFAILIGILYRQFYLNREIFKITRNEISDLHLKHEFFILNLIFAGAIGNLIDRVRMAKVIDFINLQIWPVFNFADVYLSVAAGLIIWFYLVKGEGKD